MPTIIEYDKVLLNRYLIQYMCGCYATNNNFVMCATFRIVRFFRISFL